MINEASIRCFLTLAETLSFTETARLTYMTQQSVSKYIAKLEDDLGYPLFIRTHHYVALTKAGENYYRLFSDLRRDFDAVSDSTRQYYTELGSTLRVGVPDRLDLSPIADRALQQVRKSRPSLTVRLTKHPQYELNEKFLSRELDMILTFRSWAPSAPGLAANSVLKVPLLLVYSGKLPQAKPGAVLSDFKTAPFIRAAVNREPPESSRTRARRQCRELGFNPASLLILPNLDSAFAAAEFGQGVLIADALSCRGLYASLPCIDTGRTEDLLCIRREAEENPAAPEFAAAFASCGTL